LYIVVVSFLSIFILISCSYTPNVKRVSKEELSDYNPKHFSKPKSEERIENENDLIIQAIWYEMQGEFKKSNYFYNILYEKTGNVEYMFRELTTALYGGVSSKNISKLEEWTEQNPDNIASKRLLISFYINDRMNQKAKKIGSELVSESGKAIDFELSASPYILSGEYQEAVKLLEEAYSKSFNEDILIKITTILANYLHDIDGAIEHLEKYRVQNKCSEKICNQLIEIYTKLQQVKPLMSVYQDMYKETKKDFYAVKIVEGYIYTENFDEAIRFLQNDYKNDELLYELYLAKKDYSSALDVAERLFIVQKKPKWLAESAMALYESAKNKDDDIMLKRVVDKFEKALNAGAKDSVYLNYYGYTLIDKNIDIEKGVEIIKDALKEQPNNSYYLDSLAWGYYKLNLCKEAYIEMKKVVDIEGLDEEDIAQHWTSIQECNR
jgi:lipopolysaccharide biosynthesis regulator YciM